MRHFHFKNVFESQQMVREDLSSKIINLCDICIVFHSQAAQAYTAKLTKRRHYKTFIYWEFTRFSKILENCFYCGNKFYLPSVHRILVCCVHLGRNLRSFRARTPRSVLPYKLYRRLVSSHAICNQIAKSCQ